MHADGTVKNLPTQTDSFVKRFSKISTGISQRFIQYLVHILRTMMYSIYAVFVNALCISPLSVPTPLGLVPLNPLHVLISFHPTLFPSSPLSAPPPLRCYHFLTLIHGWIWNGAVGGAGGAGAAAD